MSRTQIKSIKPLSGKIPWKAVLSHDGNEYSSYAPEVFAQIKVGDWGEAETSEETKGSFLNRWLNKWTPIEPPAAGETPPDMSEARDRRIAMESAYGSATTFYGGRDIPPKELAALARAIFRDIIAAGAGESFEPKEQKRE